MGRVAECLHWPTHNFLLEVPTVSPVFGLEVLGSYRVTVPKQHSHWLLLLSLFFFSFTAAATSKHILNREVKCTYPPVSRSPSLFLVRKRLDATWWWLSHSLSFFSPTVYFFLEKIFIFFYHTRHHSSVTSSKIKLSWTWTNHNIPPNL